MYNDVADATAARIADHGVDAPGGVSLRFSPIAERSGGPSVEVDAVFHDIVRVRITPHAVGNASTETAQPTPPSFADVHAFATGGDARFVSAYLMVESREASGGDLVISTHGHPVASLDLARISGDGIAATTASIAVTTAVTPTDGLRGVGPLFLAIDSDLAIAGGRDTTVVQGGDGSGLELSAPAVVEFFLIQGPNESKLRVRYELLSSILRSA